MGEIKGLVLVISGINGKCSPKKVFIRGCVWTCVRMSGGVGLKKLGFSGKVGFYWVPQTCSCYQPQKHDKQREQLKILCRSDTDITVILQLWDSPELLLVTGR